MRGYVNPRRSTAHKVACTSLYRGLLRQSARLRNRETATVVSSHVKRRFKLDKNAQSLTAICQALQLGRKYFNIICDAANGSETAESKLQATVTHVERQSHDLKALRVHQASLRGPTSPAKFKKIAHLQETRSKEWAQRIPNPIPIFDRPAPKEQLPHPDRPRRVPTLSSSQGIPFLRYKPGPVPTKLSRTIQSVYMQDFKLWENVKRLDDERSHASLEDAWDEIIDLDTGRNSKQRSLDNDRGHWTGGIEISQRYLKERIAAINAKTKATAERMQTIVKGERQLAIRERKAYKNSKRNQVSAVGAEKENGTQSEEQPSTSCHG